MISKIQKREKKQVLFWIDKELEEAFSKKMMQVQMWSGVKLTRSSEIEKFMRAYVEAAFRVFEGKEIYKDQDAK